MYVLVHTYVYIDTYVCMYLHVRFSFVLNVITIFGFKSIDFLYFTQVHKY